MARRRAEIPFNMGVWNRRSSLDTPVGSLQFARNAILDARVNSIRRREGHANLSSAVLATTPGHGIIQFQRVDGTVDKIIVHASSDLYSADTSKAPTFASIDDEMSDAGPSTFLYYNDKLYVSSGSGVVRAVESDGATVRNAGIANDDSISIKVTTTGSSTTIDSGLHFTYRYWDSGENVFSDPPVDDIGNLLFVSLTSSDTYDTITISDLPRNPPAGTNADTVILMMSDDETIPSTFYPHKFMTLGTATSVGDSVFQPTANALMSGFSKQFNNPGKAFDDSPDSYAGAATNGGAGANQVGTEWTTMPSGTSTNYTLQVRYSVDVKSLDANTIVSIEKGGLSIPTSVYTLLIEYSVNSGGDWTTLVSLSKDMGAIYLDTSLGAVAATTATVALTSVNPNTVQVRASAVRDSGSTTYNGPTFKIHDIRAIEEDSGDGSIRFGTTADVTKLDFINSSNIGQFQPPVARIFETIFEGHALGKSDTNGLFLAYSRTDEPEHWSTNPKITAFPYLIPFKEKEADDLVGAERVANQLVVFATDSVWRINHLPVISDPGTDSAILFAEVRSTVKRRVTDTVGCVGVKAYSRLQISSDEDIVFFWSRLGPMMTNGFSVWRVCDHVDWSYLHKDQSGCISTNYTERQRVEVALRSADASVNDHYWVFPYDPDNLIRTGSQQSGTVNQFGQILLKAFGPHDGDFAGAFEVKFASDNTKALVAVSSQTSGSESGQTYRLYAQTLDDETGANPVFDWVTNRIGKKGLENAFDRLLVNVQEDGNRSFTYGDSSVTPLLPVDKDPLQINAAGQSLEIEWLDDTVKFHTLQEDEQEVTQPTPSETVSFTKAERIINSATLFFDDGDEPVRD